MKKFAVLTLLLAFKASFTLAQSSADWLFDDSILPRVDIVIEPDSLDIILFGDTQSDYEFPATFIFSKGEAVDTVYNIGFRLRGNTSRASAKKSFKVSFNTFENGREYRGLDKMNLNGEHNDPTIMRAKLSWDIFEHIDVPAPRSNHVKLYINNEYFGLYLNVEHIDNEFVKVRFGSDAGNLYKSLYPADLSYISENPDDYKWSPDWADRRVYDLKTNNQEDDYSDLASLISFLENSSTQDFENEFDDYFNVDGALRWMAVDILTGNWDNYWYNQNNFYLYNNPATNRFEIIPYDYDNTFGIDWLGPDWGTRDINDWGPGGANRPLTNRILEVEEYRNRLHFYIDKIIEEIFNEELLFPEIDRLKALTEDAAEEDTYRTLDYGYDISDYHSSFNSALGGHVDYGLKPYISTRMNSALDQLQLENITPIIQSVYIDFIEDSALNFFVDVLDEELASVKIIIPKIEGIDFTNPLEITLSDNGSNIDKVANDGIYSGSLTEFIDRDWLSYWVEAEDTNGETNQSNIKVFNLKSSINSIIINEFMADNESGIQDEFSAYEDWIELYNPTDESIHLTDYYLTDDFEDELKWALPDTIIQPGHFLLIWADSDDEEGILHTNFGLNNDGEEIGIYFKDGENVLVFDTLSFGPQSDDISYGRDVDGSDQFVFFDAPTPGTSNGIINPIETENGTPSDIQLFQNYPNPFNPATTITFQLKEASNVTLEIFSIEGRLVQTLANSNYLSGTHSIQFDASSINYSTSIEKILLLAMKV
ncbi:MAG: CotH kinase family protein [Balneolaceae bacterium]